MAQTQSTSQHRGKMNDKAAYIESTHMCRMCLLTTKSKDSTEVNLTSAVSGTVQACAGDALVHVDTSSSFYVNGEALHVEALVQMGAYCLKHCLMRILGLFGQ